MTRHAAWHMWRLCEAGDENLGLACTDNGLLLGRTPLIERRDDRFVVRERHEIERLLSRAYQADISAAQLMSGLATVASALNANDQCLARIAAVHLRIPDIPDPTARDAMERTDVLLKYARDEGGSAWNPELHPRTGTPPNPGWFAPTDGAGHEALPVRTAQNDDPTLRSDASPIVERRVVLPPGEGNDELRDLFEWIANARPEDKDAIRAELKRQFYDKGDTNGGNILNAALDNVLGPGIQRKDRQKILDALGPYSQSEQDDEYWMGIALLLLSLVPPLDIAEAPSFAWELGWAARGFYISEQRGANLPHNFPGIDKWLNGVATSIKSIDLRAGTYQDAARLTYQINRYVDKLVLFDGATQGIWDVESSAIRVRLLDIVVPKGSMTMTHKAAFEAARLRAQGFGVDLIVTPF
jgi:hypothetical protein